MTDIKAEGASTATPGENRPAVDVLALTAQESWDEFTPFIHLDVGRFRLSDIRGLAGIGSRDTHITLDQVKALHRGLGRVVGGLDRPASEGPRMSHFVSLARCAVADLAADAGVDGDALQRHLDGVGPLSQMAFHHVFAKLVGMQTTTA